MMVAGCRCRRLHRRRAETKAGCDDLSHTALRKIEKFYLLKKKKVFISQRLRGFIFKRRHSVEVFIIS